MDTTPLFRVLEIVGTQAELARRVGNGVTQAHVWNWLKRDGGVVPPAQTIATARATEWRVTPHELRPDIYPNPDDGLPPEIRAQRAEAAAERQAA